MKVGIIVFSLTGNTLYVAKEVCKAIKKEKIDCKIDEIKIDVIGGKFDGNNFEIKKYPEIDKYDTIIFACPVHGFSVPKVVKKYFESITNLSDKKIACYVTEMFPHPWMGGNNAIRQFKTLMFSKGADIEKTGVINWKSNNRKEHIEKLCESMVEFVK